jgi:hypothetical protein
MPAGLADDMLLEEAESLASAAMRVEAAAEEEDDAP